MKTLFLLAISFLYLSANATIFMYHRFGDDRYPSTNTPIEKLEMEFQYFKENNYEVVPLKDIIKKKKLGEEIPSNWVVLTIDDAYKSFYENGLPIFKKYNYPFTLYIYTEATEKGFKDFMSWEEIKEAQKYGDMQFHGYDHLHLTKQSKEVVYEDTKKGIELFEKRLGYKPTSFAYPYGEYNEEVKNIIASFGFETILNQNNGSFNSISDLHNINRVALTGNKINIKEKLRYKTLQAEFIEPKEYPKDGILKRVVAQIDPSIKEAKLYVTSDVWRDVKVINGRVDEIVNIPLKRDRVRVMIGKTYYDIATTIIIK